jgi:ABC-type lipoprotein export system ATPase subunit
MSPTSKPTLVLEVRDLRKNYQALRPLRIRDLRVAEAERVAISGFDAAAAELLVNLVTGATLPDEGDVRVSGRSTSAISSGEEWLASLDAFGIVSDRAVLLEGATLLQNLAMPFTLEIDPVPPDVAGRVTRLAEECGIETAALGQVAGELPAPVRMRAHLARAIAPGPALLLLEHPTARLESRDAEAFAADVVRVARDRRLAALIITNDDAFAQAAADRTLHLQPATGELRRATVFSRFKIF